MEKLKALKVLLEMTEEAERLALTLRQLEQRPNHGGDKAELFKGSGGIAAIDP